MVMKRDVMRRNLRQTIRRSLGRYIAIVAIIALGAGMFVGLLQTKSDMVATVQAFTEDTGMFHLRLLSTHGWSEREVEQVRAMSGVAAAEGTISMDAIGGYDGSTDGSVYRIHSIPQAVDQVHLLGGRFPTAPDECLMDGSYVDDSVLGLTFQISDENDDATLEYFATTTFTVVGYVSTPLYMDMSRGSTTLGDGALSSYVYVPLDAFSVDYYTQIGVVLEGDAAVYSEEMTKLMTQMSEKLEPDVKVLAQGWSDKLKADGLDEYEDGLSKYEEGLLEFRQGKLDVMAQLDQGLKELSAAQAEFQSSEEQLLEGEAQLQQGQAQLDDSAALMAQSRKELADGKAAAYSQYATTYGELTQNKIQAEAGLEQVRSGLAQIESGITQIEDGLKQIEIGIGSLDVLIGVLEGSISATESAITYIESSPVADQTGLETLKGQLSQAKEELAQYQSQRQGLVDTKEELTPQLEELKGQRTTLQATEQELVAGLATIQVGFEQLEAGKVQMESQFAAAEAQIEAGQIQLDAGQKELDANRLKLEEGRTALDAARIELEQGWEEYWNGRRLAEEELSKAEAELADAKRKLDDGKEALDSMGAPEVFILDRNTNVGYLAVESNSDIVAGVSRVFPAFFLLVAALVCITTMTRMVDEERTQIGILKALGYSNGAIIKKYLVYSGSAAVLGCGLGVLVGSVVFPKILWAAYSIILNITPDIRLELNWPLCLAVVVAYSLVSMAVTWYCCRRELKEVPAELIRPKSPVAGKKILLEYLPFWDKISFLNKVMFRNVFRYRQRLLMMLLGIGGCSALLLTGFGVGDSIQNIVDYQFAEVTVYDMSAYFADGQTPQEQQAFREELRGSVDTVGFFHQSTVDLQFEDGIREISMIAADDTIRSFLDLHREDRKLDMPGAGEVYLTIGAAEAMGIREGDTVTLRDAQMRSLTLKVTGIFDNHVQNFAIVRPETVEAQWGEVPSCQTAYVNVRDGQDVHVASAKIGGMSDVASVSVSQDIADQVGSMLEALDMIVVTIVICAGLLAGIVLYNLTNISITERIREIATIKVLGFDSRETALYVFKENLLLSGMGTAVGLVGGIFLLRFVMSQIKVDMVWFQARLEPMSFLWAVVLTMLSAVIVDFILFFKLEKIHMAEALKSVE